MVRPEGEVANKKYTLHTKLKRSTGNQPEIDGEGVVFREPPTTVDGLKWTVHLQYSEFYLVSNKEEVKQRYVVGLLIWNKSFHEKLNGDASPRNIFAVERKLNKHDAAQVWRYPFCSTLM